MSTSTRPVRVPGHYVARRPMHPATPTWSTAAPLWRRALRTTRPLQLATVVGLAAMFGLPMVALIVLAVVWGFIVYGFPS